MAAKRVLSEIKQDLEAHVGQKIRLKANRGRKKVIERVGVLEQTYPHIFVIKLDEKRSPDRRVSFSYTDVLTETVELTLCYEEGDIKICGTKE
ncbi:MAG: Veg family protein [Bacillota bacterium]